MSTSSGTTISGGTGAISSGTTVSGSGISGSDHQTSLGGVTSSSSKEISKITLPGGSTYSLKDEEARNSITIIGERVGNGLPIEIHTSISPNVTQINLTTDKFVGINLYGNLSVPIAITNPTDETRAAEYHLLIRNNGGAVFSFKWNMDDLNGDLCWIDDAYKVNDAPDSLEAHHALLINIKAIDGTFFAEIHKISLQN